MWLLAGLYASARHPQRLQVASSHHIALHRARRQSMETMIATIITSAVVATVAGAAMNAWLESRKSKHVTRLDALSAAVSLEGYAIACADRVADHNLAINSGGHTGSYLSDVPELPELPVAIGFLQPKRASVANKLMIFPQEVRQANQAITFWWNLTGDIEETREAAVSETALIGLKALEISAELRNSFKLPERGLTFGELNIQATLQENIKTKK